MLRKIMQHRPGRAGSRRAVLQAETIQRSDFKMLPYREQRRLRRKHPIIISIQNPPERSGSSVV